jgi:hypothetical protein
MDGSNVLEWFEKHAGLGGWVGAIGALLAIFVTWKLARAEYLRAQRVNKERVNRIIKLFEQITREFNPIVTRFVRLLEAKDPAAAFLSSRVGRKSTLGQSGGPK